MFSQISNAFITTMINLLSALKDLTGSYGWALVIFSAIVKTALYYPTQSQYKSVKEMQKVQPEIKKLQEKYKNDPQKLQMEQMNLFKKHNINPLGGCLPLIVQMPILIGIFATIRKMAEMNSFAGETFFWIGGPLSKIYPNFIAGSLAERDIPLLLIYGVSMYLSQKMTSTSTSADNTQQMMSTIMPVAFVFIMAKFPSSLILYWLIFNLLSIVQQYIVMKDNSDDKITTSDEGETDAEDDSGDSSDEEDNEESLTVSPVGKSRSRSRKKKGGK